MTVRFAIPGSLPYPYDVQLDRHGFRNARDLDQAPIVALGDSFLEAVRLPEAALPTTKLNERLGAAVVNLGRGGLGPQQELALLRQHAPALRPRLVLWFFYEGNDTTDATFYQWLRAQPSATSFQNRSFVRSAVRGLRALASPPLQAASGDEGRRHSCQVQTETTGPVTLYFWSASHPVDQRGFQLSQQTLIEAKSFTDTLGARLVLVLVPLKFRVYHDLCSFPTDGYGRGWQLSDLPDRLATFAAEQSIPFVDLTPSLRARAPAELLYLWDDSHWSAAGAQVAVDALATRLRAERWLD